MTPAIKAGYKTTEFWLAILAQLVGLALLLGYITPEQGTALAPVLGLAAMALSAAAYAISRGLAKRAGAITVIQPAVISPASVQAAVALAPDYPPPMAPGPPKAPGPNA